jgi:hypothetical protein
MGENGDMNQAADECGWRSYPLVPRKPLIRITPDSPDWYAEADIQEQLIAFRMDEDFANLMGITLF